ncbi:hypothetical protein RHSIM_Rhsim08G0185900 [Rhododendron simsii]|uniref:Uncharacterized protein n=1 Tax=Rhododendron simsii TaxID=118357 RepID=A0A834LGD6_RHOSS|nr:hypothetical protein RHSIM_Rhsim08G0185900 [Rhododendron simsii]
MVLKMEIISKESIKPSSKTPASLRTFRLSLLDQLVPPLYVPLILFYSHDKSSSNVKLAEISPLLKRSLSDALALYYPFAGRMKGESSVDCDDQGAHYLEARFDTHLSEIVESPKVEVLNQFVPSTSKESDGVLLGIQLNYFICGGIAIGISFCHKIADACTLSMFVKTWAATARGDTNLVAPSFVASSLFPPREQFGQHMALDSPKQRTDTRRFCFSSSKIAALRAEVGASTVVQPTRVELVTAAIWKWAMARKGHDQCRLSVVCHAVNLRRRMDPPLSEYVFGNLLWGAYALGNGEMDFGGLVSKMREAIGKIDGEYLKELQGENGHDVVVRHFKKTGEWFLDKEVDRFMFTSWCRFPIYESDFGWGKPVWVSSSISGPPNSIVLMDSMSDIGGIEAWITLDEVGMMRFEQEAPNA